MEQLRNGYSMKLKNLISEQTEITGVNTINFKELTWMSTSLLCSRAYQIANAQTYVFSDSVFCVGKWEKILLQLGRTKPNGMRENNHSKDMNRIDGMPTEFEWNTTLQAVRLHLEGQDRIIFNGEF